MVSVEERTIILLAIKEPGKGVDIAHIYEKVGRDVAFVEGRKVSVDEIQRAISSLVNQGLVEKREEEYLATEALQGHARALVLEKGKEFNRSYILVWLAENYYPEVGKLMLPFLEGRPVSAVKIFSGKKDPISDLNAIFVRYKGYKPKPLLLTVETMERLMMLVFDHCIDFVPYIHRLNAKDPDIFVLDLDAGTKLLESPKAFDLVKVVTAELAEILEEKGVDPMIKFSGSRGFQIWTRITTDGLGGDPFKACREIAVSLQKVLEDYLQSEIKELRAEFGELITKDRPITTSIVARKEERASQVLVDSSVLKPMGDVRSPFSIHYKTGLASVPISKERIKAFKPEDAQPLSVMENLDVYRRAVRIRPYPISNLFHKPA